jgi:hypothetical protein
MAGAGVYREWDHRSFPGKWLPHLSVSFDGEQANLKLRTFQESRSPGHTLARDVSIGIAAGD